MLCPRRKDSPKAVENNCHLGCFLADQYRNPGNGPGFMKVVHELLGMTKGTGHFQIEPAGMNAQPGGGLLVLFAKRNPGNGPGFMKVVHELLGMTKGTGHFQIEPAGMNAQPGGGLLVLFAKRSSCHVLVCSFHYPKLEKVKKVISKAF